MAEKYSEQWWQTLKTNLQSKFDYLLSSEMDSSKYELKEFLIEEIVFKRNGTLEEIMFLISLDYLGPCDGNSSDFCRMTEKVSNDVYNFFQNNRIDPETHKFNKNAIGLVLEPLIINVKFKLDEQHEYLLFVKVDYNE